MDQQQQNSGTPSPGSTPGAGTPTPGTSPTDANGAPISSPGTGTSTGEGTKSEPFAVFPTKDAFDERVKRAARSMIKSELGLEDVGQIKTLIAEREQLRKAEEERKAAEMTEVEKLKAENDKARARLTEIENEAKAARTDAEITRLCAERGIRDIEYAKFKLRASRAGDDKDLEDTAYLDKLLQLPKERIALGVDKVPADGEDQTVITRPAGTTPVSNPLASPKPPPAGGGGQQKSAYDMKPDEWQQWRRANGLM